MIKVIGKNKLKKAKGRNVFTEIYGARHDNNRVTPIIKFKKKTALSINDNSLTV